MKNIKIYTVIILFVSIINILSRVVFAIANINEIEIEEYNKIIVNELDEENALLENNTIKNNMNLINDDINNELINESDNEIIDNDNREDENNNIIIDEQNDDIIQNMEENNSKMSLPTTVPSIEYRTHVQDVGWQKYVENSKTAGTEGKSLRLEGINIKLKNTNNNLNIKYQVHIQDIGWQSWKKNGEMAGTEGKSLRLEAIRINLEDSDDYSIMYRVHVQDIGWQDWKTDGEIAGTEGKSLRLEAIQIKIIPKQARGKLYLDTPVNGNLYYTTSKIDFEGWKMANISNTYIKAYIDNNQVDSSTITYYDRTDVTNSILNYGTTTQNAKAGFKFSIPVDKLSNGNHTIKIELYSKEDTKITTINSNFKIDKNLHVNYRSHVQDIGWQGYVMDGVMSGTSGKSYRVEAINIELINAPSNAKILYRTHVQDIGWQNWKANGELAGTSGKSLRVEAIEIKLENMDNYTIEYQVHIQDKGWSDWYIDGETAGTVGQSKRIEAVRIKIVPQYKRSYKGIDVSQYNGNINWGFVKRDNIDFAFIRVGYRGYGQEGNFAEDTLFRTNIVSATNAGLPVGIYFVTQATTEAEAIEEANWVLSKIKDYNINYPIAIDIEKSQGNPGRADNLDKETRTNLAKIFCNTIKNSGYTPIVYTNVDWATNKLNMSKLSEYDTWIASYRNESPGYNGKYSIWQYSDKGSINGILGNVDLNISYKKY